MYAIGLAAPTFDLAGDVVLYDIGAATDLRSLSRRVTRTATLDGGVALSDSGFADGDRTLRIEVERIGDAVWRTLRYLIATYSRLYVSTEEGCFFGTVDNARLAEGSAVLTFLVESKVSE